MLLASFVIALGAVVNSDELYTLRDAIDEAHGRGLVEPGSKIIEASRSIEAGEYHSVHGSPINLNPLRDVLSPEEIGQIHQQVDAVEPGSSTGTIDINAGGVTQTVSYPHASNGETISLGVGSNYVQPQVVSSNGETINFSNSYSQSVVPKSQTISVPDFRSYPQIVSSNGETINFSNAPSPQISESVSVPSSDFRSYASRFGQAQIVSSNGETINFSSYGRPQTAPSSDLSSTIYASNGETINFSRAPQVVASNLASYGSNYGYDVQPMNFAPAQSQIVASNEATVSFSRAPVQTQVVSSNGGTINFSRAPVQTKVLNSNGETIKISNAQSEVVGETIHFSQGPQIVNSVQPQVVQNVPKYYEYGRPQVVESTHTVMNVPKYYEQPQIVSSEAVKEVPKYYEYGRSQVVTSTDTVREVPKYYEYGRPQVVTSTGTIKDIPKYYEYGRPQVVTSTGTIKDIPKYYEYGRPQVVESTETIKYVPKYYEQPQIVTSETVKEVPKYYEYGKPQVVTSTETIRDLPKYYDYGRPQVVTSTDTVRDVPKYYGRPQVVTSTGTIKDIPKYYEYGRPQVVESTQTVTTVPKYYEQPQIVTSETAREVPKYYEHGRPQVVPSIETVKDVPKYHGPHQSINQNVVDYSEKRICECGQDHQTLGGVLRNLQTPLSKGLYTTFDVKTPVVESKSPEVQSYDHSDGYLRIPEDSKPNTVLVQDQYGNIKRVDDKRPKDQSGVLDDIDLYGKIRKNFIGPDGVQRTLHGYGYGKFTVDGRLPEYMDVEIKNIQRKIANDFRVSFVPNDHITRIKE